MKHFAARAMFALSVVTLPLPALADVDPATVPELKRSRLQLYLTAQEAHDIMRRESARTLFLDVRTRAEAMFVGMPVDADALVPYVEVPEIMTDWDDKRSTYMLMPNSDFVGEAGRRLQAKGLGKTDRVIVMCRSGDRSAHAADLLANAGYTHVYSIVEGFEGDLAKDGPKAGQRVVNGWKNDGLPWTYKLDKAKMYFPR